MKTLFTILFFVLLIEISISIKLKNSSTTFSKAPCKNPCAKFPDLFVDELGNCYITLVNENLSTNILPTSKPWASVSSISTNWHRIRIDPDTLLIHTGDFKFSTSSGGPVFHHSVNTNQQTYGSAIGCEAPYVADAQGIVDLRGTKWEVETVMKTRADGTQYDGTFDIAGYLPSGSFSHPEPQVWKISGGGFCGWISPGLISGDEYNTQLGGWYLKVKRLN
jgi:hypothetical protein